MSKIIAGSPVLFVPDIDKAANFYSELLGFLNNGIWGSDPRFCMAMRDAMMITLQECRGMHTVPNSQATGMPNAWDISLMVNDLDALCQEYQEKGVGVLYSPRIFEEHNFREFAIKDINGYVLSFGEDWTGEEVL